MNHIFISTRTTSMATKLLTVTIFNTCLMTEQFTGLLLNLIKERNEPFPGTGAVLFVQCADQVK